MRKHKLAFISPSVCAVAVVLGSTQANAQTRPARGTESVTQQVVPSGSMLAGGLTTFALSYGPSVGVGLTSDRPEDHHLLVPIAGPWIDLGNRGGCGGLAEPSCDTETTYTVLLVVDGVVQGLSALTVVGAFFTPESRTVTRTVAPSEPRLRIAPASLGAGGYGALATGRF
jgi:hypothetical protein